MPDFGHRTKSGARTSRHVNAKKTKKPRRLAGFQTSVGCAGGNPQNRGGCAAFVSLQRVAGGQAPSHGGGAMHPPCPARKRWSSRAHRERNRVAGIGQDVREADARFEDDQLEAVRVVGPPYREYCSTDGGVVEILRKRKGVVSSQVEKDGASLRP